MKIRKKRRGFTSAQLFSKLRSYNANILFTSKKDRDAFVKAVFGKQAELERNFSVMGIPIWFTDRTIFKHFNDSRFADKTKEFFKELIHHVKS